MASLADALKEEIFNRFQHGELFSIDDFQSLRERHGCKYVSRSLGKLADYSTACIVVVEQNLVNGRKQNFYRVRDTKEIDYKQGDVTRWHSGIPSHYCADGEVYRVRFWDRSEGLRAWRKGWWWDGEKKLARDFVMEWSGVVR